MSLHNWVNVRILIDCVVGLPFLNLNELESITEIWPIIFLLSVLPQRTWVDFRNLANFVLAQRFASTHLDRFQKFGRLRSCSAFYPTHLGKCLTFKPVALMFSILLRRTLVNACHLTDCVDAQLSSPRTLVNVSGV